MCFSLSGSNTHYSLYSVVSSSTLTKPAEACLCTCLGYGFCHFVVGGVLSSGEYVPAAAVDGNLELLIRVTGSKAHTVIGLFLPPYHCLRHDSRSCRMVYAARSVVLETRPSEWYCSPLINVLNP